MKDYRYRHCECSDKECSHLSTPETKKDHFNYAPVEYRFFDRHIKKYLDEKLGEVMVYGETLVCYGCWLYKRDTVKWEKVKK